MNYSFTNKYDYANFFSNLREKARGNQATIYFDDENGKVIKIFSLENFDSRKKEAKLKELMKFKNRFPTAALPEKIIKYQGMCVGYVMPKLPDAMSLEDFQFLAKKQKTDLKENLKIACELARFIENIHSEGIVFGDLHPGQFMTMNGKIYICDTDTWGFVNKGEYYEADKVGIVEYVDPKIRDINKKGVAIKGYTKKSDYFSLAVVIFEMLSGANPFDGEYPLLKENDRDLKALNHISILGNHDLKGPSTFMMKHIAWMSEELQTDFLQIFEGNERFNILHSLENQAKDLKECEKHHYYNSSRYSTCPCCEYKDSDALMKFRNYDIDSISYDKYGIFPQKNIRRIVNFSTILDRDENAIHLKESGQLEQTNITRRTIEVYFTERGFVVKVSRISELKKYLNTVFGKYDALYGNCSFDEKLNKYRNPRDPVCKLEIFSPNGQELYSTLILRLTSKLKIVGDHLFFLKDCKDLIDIYMTEDACHNKVVTTITSPFWYEINELGEYCMCILNKGGKLNVIVNGKVIKQLINEIPRTVKYDYVSKSWCVVTRNKKIGVYKTYIIEKNNGVEQMFNFFSFDRFNLGKCIFINSMLAIPANKRIIFLKFGSTVEKSMVSEKPIGIVNPNSKIAIRYNSLDKCTYLYVQNRNQVYKINLS